MISWPSLFFKNGWVMDLSLEISQLNHFSSQAEVAEIIRGLQRLHDNRSWLENVFYPPQPVSQLERNHLIEDLRRQLQVVFKKADSDFTVSKPVSLAKASHDALLALAKLSPKNDVDPVTFDEIPKSKQVVIADGWQYNIDNVVRFQKTRPARKETHEVKRNYKQLIDPRTNEAFSPRDSAHIQRVAAEKGITIEWRINQDAPHADLLRNAEELKHLVAQKELDEIANFLGELNPSCDLYGHNLETTLSKLGAKLEKAKHLLNLYDNVAWRARWILCGCSASVLGYALESLLTNTASHLDFISSWGTEVGLAAGAGLAIYGLMASPKNMQSSLTAVETAALDYLASFSRH